MKWRTIIDKRSRPKSMAKYFLTKAIINHKKS